MGMGFINGDDYVEELEDGDDGAAEKAYQEALNRIGNLSVAELLASGQEALLRHLVAAVNTGQASHQEMSILRNLLKDNGLVITVAPPSAPEPDIGELPSLQDPDYA